MIGLRGTSCNRAAVAFAALAIATASASYAADQTIIVSGDNANGWGFFVEVPNATAILENGPDTPPLGAGSANLVVDGTGRVVVGTLSLAGLPMGVIDHLTYWTYQKAGSPGSTNLAISLQFDVDYDSTDADDSFQGRLVFEPVNNPAQGAVQKGVWQQWDALNGNWWMTGTPIVGGVPGVQTCPQSAPCSFTQVLTDFPNARVRPAIGATILKAGGPWTNGFDGNVDAFTVGIGGMNTTFDFEVSEVVDSDGDGIPDEDDDCPNSDLSATVVIDGCDSGVTNVLFANGCTISDYVAAIAGDAKNHGKFVSNVAKLVNALKKDGAISNKDAAAIKRCAAQSNLP
jgi:hypothetical protein